MMELQLTENFQLKAADALISKLRIELGAANAYIEELEFNLAEGLDYKTVYEQNKTLKQSNKELQRSVNTYKQTVDKITAKYSLDLEVLNREEAIKGIREKYQKEISQLTEDLARVTKQRDSAITELLRKNGN